MELIKDWKKDLDNDSFNMFNSLFTNQYYCGHLSPDDMVSTVCNWLLQENSDSLYEIFDDKLLSWMNQTWGQKLEFKYFVNESLLDRYTLNAWCNVNLILSNLRNYLPKSTRLYVDKITEDTNYFQSLIDRFNNGFLIFSTAITLWQIDPDNKSVYDGEKLLISTHLYRDYEIIRLIEKRMSRG